MPYRLLAFAPASYTEAWALQLNVEVHAEDTRGGIIFDTQVDVLSDSEAKVACVTTASLKIQQFSCPKTGSAITQQILQAPLRNFSAKTRLGISWSTHVHKQYREHTRVREILADQFILLHFQTCLNQLHGLLTADSDKA